MLAGFVTKTKKKTTQETTKVHLQAGKKWFVTTVNFML